MTASPAPEAHEAALAELRAHRPKFVTFDSPNEGCTCGEQFPLWQHDLHLAAVLVDRFAGWLPPETVTEARARELREAADATHSRFEGSILTRHEADLVARWLRARADSLAPEAPSEEQR